MKIGFFLQNSKQGGLDTFVLQLLQNWPYPDTLVLFCNESHPGLCDLSEQTKKSTQVESYNFLIAQDFDRRFMNLPIIFKLPFKIIFWAMGFLYQVNILKKILSRSNLDRLLVINGGYPAGDACQAATVAWSKLMPDNKAWHNFHNILLPISKSLARRLKDVWIDKQVKQAAKGFVTVSNACMDSLFVRPVFRDARREFIYNGIVNLEPKFSASLLDEISLDKSSKIILMLSVYEPRKGHKFIIQVMELLVEKCSQAQLIICGDGSKEEVEVVDRMRRKSCVAEHIHLLEYRSDITNLFAQAQVLVVPSQSFESFGYTAVEAMCCEVPVVVTDIGGLPEVVEDGVCGYVVSHQDKKRFADRIAELLDNESLRKSMGKHGKERHEKHFSAKQMALEYAKLVRD